MHLKKKKKGKRSHLAALSIISQKNKVRQLPTTDLRPLPLEICFLPVFKQVSTCVAQAIQELSDHIGDIKKEKKKKP